jgi:hypothetical protein
MQRIIVEAITSLLTIAVFWLMGSKWKYAPVLGIITQGFWVWYVVLVESWFLGISVVFILGVHIRNSVLWLRGNGKIN